jgi:DNA-binding Lrp family transcriptional regulator
MFLSAREKIILRELSKDSRISLSSIAKLTGCSYVTVGKIINKLTEKFDIKFVLELDLTKLGFLQRHLLMVKFSRKPPEEWLEAIFKRDKNVHAAYLADGQFDLVIFAAESNPINYALWESVLKQELSDYGAVLSSSDLAYFSFGYMAVDHSFIDDITVPMKKNEKLLLNLLNENSRISYSELARQLKLTEPTIRYKTFNLVKKGIIRRFTIAVQKPPQEYTIGFFERWASTRKFEERAALSRKYRMDFDQGIPILTTFQMSAPLTGSYGNFIMGLFDNKKDALENSIEKQKEIYRAENYEVKYAKIIRPLKGIFPFRNLDIRENYNVVKWQRD